MAVDTYIPADCLPGVMSGWTGPYQWSLDGGRWYAWPQSMPATVGGSRVRLDTRFPEVRDRLVRVIADMLGAPVGATAPGWAVWTLEDRDSIALVCALRDVDGVDLHRWCSCQPRVAIHADVVPALASTPIDSLNLDALTLAAIARWLAAEFTAGRIIPRKVHHA